MFEHHLLIGHLENYYFFQWETLLNAPFWIEVRPYYATPQTIWGNARFPRMVPVPGSARCKGINIIGEKEA
jgi:hypothetical protein